MKASRNLTKNRSRPTQVVRIIGQTTWKVTRNLSTGVYVGECDSLNVTAQGATRAGLLRMIDDILQTLLADMVAEKRLERVAREQGWKIEGELPTSRSRSVRLRFDLPFVVPEMIGPHVAAA